MMKTPCFCLMTDGRQAARTPMPWPWRSAAPKTTHRFSRALLLAFLFAPALALGQATGPQPGATDPLDGPRGYALFRDDELFMS
ncbi:MAG: hypothetical protein ACRERU_21595, partial [Methylococcales bacterium]